jgi:hypothetical protein
MYLFELWWIFVHVNIKDIPRSQMVRLLRRGKTCKAFVVSASKQDTAWRIAWSSSSGPTWMRFHLEKDGQIKIVNNMSADFRAIERLSFVIRNVFCDSLVWYLHVPSLRRFFSSKYSYFDNNGFDHHIMNYKCYFS